MQASRPNNFLETLIKHLEEEVETEQTENDTPNEDSSTKEEVFDEAVIHGSDEYASCMLENDDIRCISQSDRQLEEIKVTPLQNCTGKNDTTTKERKELHKAIEKVTPSLMQPNLKHTKSL